MRIDDGCQYLPNNWSGDATFKVALVSFLFDLDVERNLSAIADAVENARAKGCKLICFPECALTGLPKASSPEDYEFDIKLATEIPGDITDKIGKLARTAEIYIAISLLEKSQGKLYDTAVLFNDKGEIVLKYRRINPQWHGQNAPKNPICRGNFSKHFLHTIWQNCICNLR